MKMKNTFVELEQFEDIYSWWYLFPKQS